MTTTIKMAGRRVGQGHPTFIIAEMSANHGGKLEHAVRVIEAAKECGADAVKIQTYTPDTLTIPCSKPDFQIGKDSLWAGRTLYDLYAEAFTPWEWQPRLKEVADDLGIICFSTPFDPKAVDFLENLNMPAHKIASFELVDTPLVEYIARTGKPAIMSTGMASLEEIDIAVKAFFATGNRQLALLKCTSAYPAAPEEMNLCTIPHLAEAFGVPAGLSDHTMGTAVPVAAVALGACIVEKHFCLSRSEGGPDSAFSMEPDDLRQLVKDIRMAEAAVGKVCYAVTEKEEQNRIFRRSLYVVKDVRKGDVFTAENVRSIRPGFGMPPKYLHEVLGRKATEDIERGTPMNWGLVGS